ncbi:interleukin-23 receptor [Podarcis lilfordi]|uniref:Interleukin-23 receptor n=1 Tax=Podarcis lilfordi TaxID=74358 RepID=A0AA35P9C7_9SAUR|nr:interleukin-23 receptor [Podarcis lilfordi]
MSSKTLGDNEFVKSSNLRYISCHVSYMQAFNGARVGFGYLEIQQSQPYLSADIDTIHCPGKVWTEPASTIQMGQNITINCHSDKDVCQNAKKRMRLNQREVEDRLVSVINKTTVQLQLHNYNISFSTVICYTVCPPEKNQIICGTEFCVGHSPDMPANLTCVVYEYSDNMTCTWDPGKNTQLSTRYNLYLKSFQGEENKTFPANNASGTIPLSQMWKNKTFYVGVCAENHLGTNCSEELYVHLDDLVVPATPIIIQIIDSPLFKTTIQWEKQTAINETYCEERYKEKTGETWQNLLLYSMCGGFWGQLTRMVAKRWSS